MTDRMRLLYQYAYYGLQNYCSASDIKIIRILLQILSTTLNFGSSQSNINTISRENQIELVWYSQISLYCSLLSYDEDGDSKFFRNIDAQLAQHVMSQPRDHNMYFHCRDNMRHRVSPKRFALQDMETQTSVTNCKCDFETFSSITNK
jgi:hypothetical protein